MPTARRPAQGTRHVPKRLVPRPASAAVPGPAVAGLRQCTGAGADGQDPRRPGGGVRQSGVSGRQVGAAGGPARRLVGQPPRQQRPGVVPADLHRAGAAREGRTAGAVHRACLHQPAGLPERPADPQRRADERADHAELQPPAADQPAGRTDRPGPEFAGHQGGGPRAGAGGIGTPRRRAVGAGDRAEVGAGRQTCPAGGAERGCPAGGERDAAADGQLHVRARLDQPARKPPGLLRRAVGGLGHRRVAPLAAQPARRQRRSRVPAVRHAAAADLGQRAVPAALCPVPPPLDRHRHAAAGRGDAGDAAAGWAGAAVPDGQLLVCAAGAAGLGRRGVLPAHAVPRTAPRVLADGPAAVPGHRSTGSGICGAEVRHPRAADAAGADRPRR